MDRQIVYPGSIPLDTDLLSIQRNTMVAIGYLAQMVIGKSSVAEGLLCTPTAPATMSISIGPGSLSQFGVVDTTPFGSLGALANTPLLRMGVNLGATNFALSAPTAAGQTIAYLVQASLQEIDAIPIVLPYYNASNPSQPYSGPSNQGTPQMTQRLQSVELALKAGPAVLSGTLAIPNVDTGWVGLYVIAVNSGQTTVTATNIATLPTAPFLTWRLPQLSPGTHKLAVFQPTTQGNWTAPAGVTALKVRLWGGGGAGGSGLGGGGGGGGGGGYSEGFYTVSPGQTFTVAVGNGGAGSGSAGGTSSFGSLASASGGQSGGNGSAGTGGIGATLAGGGFGSGLGIIGGAGGDCSVSGPTSLSGSGGAAYTSAGGVPAVGATSNAVAGKNGCSPGGGGSGGVGSGIGGQGGSGLALVEW